MSGGFQQQVYSQPAPAVEGDFCSQNPYFTYDAGPGGLVAGASGVVIGRFAWTTPPIDPNGTNQIANSFGSGAVAGFVHREMQGLYTAFLGIAGMTIQPGFMVTLMTGGDFWVKNNGLTEAVPGNKAYARYSDGAATFAASGAPLTGASVTGSIAASTFSVTGSITNGTLNVTVVGSGTVVPGATITGSGIASGTKVVTQLTGTPGGVGTYSVNIPEQTVASTTVSGTYGTMTVTVVGSGTLAVGDTVSGSGVTSGTTITALGTGVGGTGTYIVDPTQTAGSTTITAVSNIETKWVAMSAGAPGELVKISSQATG